MSFTGGRLKLKGDDSGVKKKKRKKSKAEDESKALQLVEESTAKESVAKVHSSMQRHPNLILRIMIHSLLPGSCA